MTEKDKDTLEYIKAYLKEHGYMPSVREIAEGIGVYSTSTAYAHYSKLFELGYLKTDRVDGAPRAYRLAAVTRPEQEKRE